MRLPRGRRPLVALGVAALVAVGGGVVAATHPSGSGTTAVRVEAGGRREPPGTGGGFAVASSTSTSPTTADPPASSSSTSTTRAPKVTTSSLPATTTTVPACAPTRPLYGFGLVRRPDGNGWAAGGNPALQRSTDGGRTWTPACLPAEAVTGPGGLYGVVFDPLGRHGWVVGGSGGRPVAFRTVDGGAHWLAAALPGDIAGSLTDAEFADLLHGWAVGNRTGVGPANAAGGVLLGTGDGGLTWTAQPVPDGIGRLNRVTVIDTAHAWAVGVSTAGQPLLIATGDGGSTWSTSTLPDGIRELRDVGFVNATRGWAVGALPIPSTAEGGLSDPGVVLTTSDGGATWTQQATTVGSLWSVAVVDTDTVFAGGGYGLFSTSDGGATWSRQAFALPALDAISFTDATHGWVTHSMFSTVCRTDDGGRTWVASVLNPEVTAKPCTPA